MSGILLVGVGVAVVLILVLVLRIFSLISVASGVNKKDDGRSRNFNGTLFILMFLLGFGWIFWYSVRYFDAYNLPLASEHGKATDTLFWITMAVTGVVFVATHVLLFFFPSKYKYNPKRKALFYPDNHKLEILWTSVPAVVLSLLVFSGLKVWSDITKDAPEDAVVFEAVGYQFAWDLRYPGPDGKLAAHDFNKTDAINSLAIDYTDPNFRDDFISNEIHVPVNKPVQVKIRAKDVLHSFFLPHFRVKMDAVPGMPTSFWFTPTKTTAEMREELSKIPEWREIDPETGNPRYMDFNYELACTEVCGEGHYSMRKIMIVETEDEYNDWIASQTPWSELNKEYLAEKMPELYDDLTASNENK